MKGSTESKNHDSILHFTFNNLSLFLFMSQCTRGVGVQVLPFIGNVVFILKLDTVVQRCEPSELKVTQNGKKEVMKGFDVTLEDTVLFPEGGGQVSMQLNQTLSCRQVPILVYR